MAVAANRFYILIRLINCLLKMVFDYSEKKEIVRKTNSDILMVRFIKK